MRISDWSSDVCSSDLNRPCLGGPYGRARAAPARTRWRTGNRGIPNYSVWRGFPAAGRTLNARRPKTPREDTIQPAPAMITSRKHTRRIAMQAPLKLAALLLALAAVAMPATAAARDNDRGHRGHDRSSYYDRDRRGHHDRDRYDRRAYRHDRRHDRRDRPHDRRIVIRGPRVIHRSPRYYSPRPVVVHRGPPRWNRGHRYYRSGYGRHQDRKSTHPT